MRKSVDAVIREMIAQERGQHPGTPFMIIKITDVARKITRNIYQNGNELIPAIQQWFANLPTVSKTDARKCMELEGKRYLITPAQAMRNYYAHFDVKRKTGCLLSIVRM